MVLQDFQYSWMKISCSMIPLRPQRSSSCLEAVSVRFPIFYKKRTLLFAIIYFIIGMMASEILFIHTFFLCYLYYLILLKSSV